LSHALVLVHYSVCCIIVMASTCIAAYVTSQLQTSNGNQREDKSAQNSTTEVSFCTIIIRLSQCTTVITMV